MFWGLGGANSPGAAAAVSSSVAESMSTSSAISGMFAVGFAMESPVGLARGKVAISAAALSSNSALALALALALARSRLSLLSGRVRC